MQSQHRWIKELTIKGFKSIRSLENFELRALNILIGANGAGKSNFVSFFTFLHELVEGDLAVAVETGGGADAHLFLGPKATKKISAELRFGWNGYAIELKPTIDNRLVLSDERVQYVGSRSSPAVNESIGTGRRSSLKAYAKAGEHKAIAKFVHGAITSWIVYHFHDTSDTAPMRRYGPVIDHDYLRRDGANLAAFLFHLQEERASTFELICDTIRLVAPFFVSVRPIPFLTDVV
jgi:predicted ATPase